MMRATRHEVTIVDRYTPGARINHWITAGSLILLALSGLAFFHPSLFFLTGLFGGGTAARIIHPWIGVVLLITSPACSSASCASTSGTGTTPCGCAAWAM
jgi:cytochrome b subunit of formate dehydrogenase